MDDMQPLRQAAISAGVDRNTLSRWVKAGLLKSKAGQVRHLTTTLVSVERARELAKVHKPGRPRKEAGGRAAAKPKKVTQ